MQDMFVDSFARGATVTQSGAWRSPAQCVLRVCELKKLVSEFISTTQGYWLKMRRNCRTLLNEVGEVGVSQDEGPNYHEIRNGFIDVHCNWPESLVW